MALISPQAATVAGPAITYATATASDTFRPVDRGVLLYRTAGTASNVTVVVPGNTQYGQPQPDVVVALGATDARAINAGAYVAAADQTTGLVTVTSSSQTALTVAYVTV